LKVRLFCWMTLIGAAGWCLGVGPARARVRTPRAAGEVRIGWKVPVRSVALGPKGRLLVAGGDAGEVVIYDTVQGRIRWRLSARGKVTALALSPDGRRLAVGWQGRHVELVDATTGRGVRRLGPLKGWPRSLAFSPKGDVLAVAGQAQRIALFDPKTGRALGELRGHTSWISHVAFSPDGRLLASAGWDHAVRIWDVRAQQLLRSAFGHRFAVNAVVFTHDGRTVISASDDQTMRVIKVRSGVSLKRIRGPAITTLALAARADRLVAGTFNGRLVNLTQKQLHAHRVVAAHKGAVLTCAISPDGRLAVTGGRDGRVRIWKVR
jgi:WD40 repeat protein